MLNIFFSVFGSVLFLLPAFSFTFFLPIQKLSVEMTAKSLHQGKYVTAKAEVYYRTSGGLMVTHFTSPFEQIVITNAKGEYKSYDVKNNTLVQSQGIDFSSKNSFFYSFLSGKTQDMGLSSFGYTLHDTRVDNEMIITTWQPPGNAGTGLSKVEIVHENSLPVFMGFYDMQNKPVHKVFYSDYQTAGTLKMPMSVTEFQYLAEHDSVVSRRSYSNVKLNESVVNTYLDFKIPVNAKLVKPE